jgi:hypothetical protein
MTQKIVRVGDYYYTLSLTDLIRKGDWYLDSTCVRGGGPIQSKDPPCGWGEQMLEDGLYLKIIHTSNPNIKLQTS